MKKYFKSILMVVALFAVAIIVAPNVIAAPVGEFVPSFNKTDFVPDEVVVKFKNDNRPFRVVKSPPGQSVEQAVANYRNMGSVEFAEPNYIATKYSTPNDPLYSLQWHFDNAVYGGVHAESAWDVSTGSGATVAVVDSGIAYENYNAGRGEKYYLAPDLAGTCFVQGYDFVNNDAHANDDDSHGTHVAGTIAQSTNNSEGVAGLAYSSCIMPVKVLDRNGNGTYADVADGIRFAVDNGAQVINLSLGGSAPGQVVEDAVAYAYSNGVTVIAATGNDNGAVGYPAAYDSYVIAVGATRYDEERAPYSNFGPSVDVVAPGGDLDVDQNGDGYGDGVLQNTFNPNNKKRNDFGYWFFDGTSMATPHIAAIAAMVISNGNATTPDDVRAAIESTADDLGTAGHDDLYGWGLVNAPAALAWTSGPVDSPPSVTIINPTEGTTVVGSSTISADATDDNGVVQVDFYVDSSLIGTDFVAPYEMYWNSTLFSDGAHTITATAVDTVAQTTNDSVNITIDNVNDPPVANAGPDQTANDDDNNGSEFVALDGSASFDPDGTIVNYDWYVDGVLAQAGSSSVFSSVYNVGSYTVTLIATDDDGATGSDNALVTVLANQSPTANAGSDQVVEDSDEDGSHAVTLDGSDSSDPDGTMVSFEWYEGAALLTTGINPTITLSLGDHTITLVVTDNGSATANDTMLASIVAPPPPADITLSAIGYKIKGRQKADLSWSGAGSTNIDVYRDSILIATTPNDGFYTDNINSRGGGSYVYQVCEEGTTACSNESTVSF